MKQTYLLLLLLSVSITGFGNDTTKVLFIGNSFTYTHNVPQIVKKFAEAANMPFKFYMHAPGGISVGDVDQGTSAHMNNPTVFDLIRSDDWDYVVLQDNQGRFSFGYGMFPAVTTSKVIEGHVKITDSVRANHPCARMVWFAGWGFKQGHPSIGTGEQMIKNIHGNYSYLNDSLHEIISPIGIAWLRSISALPSIDPWGPDAAHQSAAGSYLTASVLFSSMFRVNPEMLNIDSELDEEVAQTMRRIAWQTVIDSMAPTHLSAFAPALTISGGTLTASTGYAQYDWYRDNVFITSMTSNTLPVNGTNCYQVIVTDNNSCRSRSISQCIFPVDVDGYSISDSHSVFPNPAADQVTFSYRYGASRMTVSNVHGKTVFDTALPIAKSSYQWNATAVPPGMYLYKISYGNTRQETGRIMIVK